MADVLIQSSGKRDAHLITCRQDVPSLSTQVTQVLQASEELLMEKQTLLERSQALLMERRNLLEHQKSLMLSTKTVPSPEMLQKLTQQHQQLSRSHTTAMVLYRWITDHCKNQQQEPAEKEQ